ncbi:MAG: hypothetical protein JOZ75_00910 [Candidatus Dormibacteraeota bacterium]|nr:hypothetical protein [Candidatus Dormibacteraeota bacterium]
MRRLIVLITVAIAVAACGEAAGSTPTTVGGYTPATSVRPASPVHVTLVTPTNGQVVHGSTVHVVVSITGGTVTPVYSTHISSTVGHVHLYMNKQLVYMSYTLVQDLPVNAGTEYSMYAEWVASDHFPFDPRDVTSTIFFTVAPS